MGRNSPWPDPSENPEPPQGGEVVCFGFLTYCLLLMVDQLPPRNGGAAVLETVDTVGDDAAIVASILTRWKVPTRLVSSPVGNDHHGQKVMNHLNAWGVDLEERVSHEITTPVEVGIVDGSGGRTYFQRRDASAMAALTPPVPGQLSRAGMLYVDWYDGPSIPAAMEIAFSRGVPVFLNLESQYNKDSPLTGMLQHTRICQVSLDEPGAGEDPVEVARWLVDQGVGTALVTMGSDGCVVAQGRGAFRVLPPAVQVADCYGAGAAFSAGIIYGVRAGWALEASARFASAYAGLKCEVKGMAKLSVREIRKAAATVDVRPLPL
jgi:sugar/nucleoside kinase (ribokinase family)